jgi:hypothetical protein
MNTFKAWLGLALVAVLSACGGGNDIATTTTTTNTTTTATNTVQLAQTSTVAGLTYFYQQGVLISGGNCCPDAPAVGSPNYYDLRRDFTLGDGFYDQFDGGLQLSVVSSSGTSTATISGSFPSDQQYSELTFNTPEYGAANGSVGAYFTRTDALSANASSTNTAAWLIPSPDSRLQQTVTFPSTTGTLTLTWAQTNNASQGNFGSEPSSYFRVVLRSNTGTVATLFSQGSAGTTGTAGSADVTSFAGQTLILSFEARSTRRSIMIDDVSLLNGATQVITNGNFSANGTGWLVNTPTLTQNVTSGTRTVADLTVQRSVYVPPTEKWGRWTDVFSNPTSTTVQATVTYFTNLGSDNAGFVYTTPNTNSKSLSSWDGSGDDRDIALVHGAGATVRPYTNPTTVGSSGITNNIYFDYVITVAPGARVSIVQFVVMGDEITGSSPGVTTNSRATVVDGIAQGIVNNFRSDPKYRNGMTQRQIDSILNF